MAGNTERGRVHMRRIMAGAVATAIVAGGLLTVPGEITSVMAQAARPVEPQRINLTQQDMEFILAQIQISEAHPDGTGTLCTDPAALTDALACVNSLTNKNLPFGLRNTDGRNNNITPGQALYGAADLTFPRLTAPKWMAGDGLFFDADGPGPLQVGDATSYAQNSGIVVDKEPRIISNLIADQTEHNPAATAAAAETVGHGFGATTIQVDNDRNPTTPSITQYVMPNVAPDAGFSASYNSLFTIFGQFFDHGLDLAAKGGSGNVFVPLQPDDPLYVPGGHSNFMVLTRATNQPGPDGVLGTDDDIKDATNQVTPYIDNNQTYTSHPSHQVFVREYSLDVFGHPTSTGRLLEGIDGGLPTWADVKAQAVSLLGIELADSDISNVPLLATDAYGRFLPGVDGYPQLVLPDGTTMEGNPLTPISPTAVGAVRTGHSFLNDIAHSAVPSNGGPDADTVAGTSLDTPWPAGTYDNELLDAHFICGDGRCNENIGLTAMHDIFHSEHQGLVQQIEELVTTLPNGSPAALGAWLLPDGSWNGDRIFQAAKFVNEMEYQHIVFGEFARAIQPNVNLFGGYDTTKNPAITAEFAHAVYRFGHSMLTETVARTNADGTTNDIPLMEAFLNPTSFNDDGHGNRLSADQASGSIIRGMVSQRGDEIDEFVTEALRNNLVGLPLDLPSLNITRARSEGIAPLNEVRRELFNSTLTGAGGNASLKPYQDWQDFGMSLRHAASLVNFVAAYGQHPTILAATTNEARRAAADALVNDTLDAPADAADFMKGNGDWADVDGKPITGLEDIDLWMGGLAEAPPLFGGMLGTTFNYVFESQMEALQDNDRMYYLLRTEGLPLVAELEGNMFSDLIRRNTDATNIPVLAFTRADYTFDLSAQTPIDATHPKGGPILDDPATPYNEPNLDGVSKMVRMSDGTIRLTGKGTTENHTTWLGTNGTDKIRSAEGDDSLWGNDGDDTLEGGIGADFLEGNDGNDVLTDANGDDTIAGGNGNDVMHGGRGVDLLFGDNGDDAIFHGSDDKESFAGSGNDLVMGGAGADATSGGPGRDWLEGGEGGDFLVGDERGAFVLLTGEDDVIIGGAGDDRYLAEGGMDIMMNGSGLDTSNGGLGFDFVSYARETSAAFADLRIAPVIAGGLANPRDRFSLVEGLSGGPFNDSMRGDDRVLLVGHELTQANLDSVTGLEDLLSRGSVLAAPGILNRFTGDDIVMGGAGSDELEGGGGADFIDGDAELNVHLQCTYVDGTLRNVDTLDQIQNDVIARRVTPDACVPVKEITVPTDDSAIDAAIYRFPMDEYIVGQLPDGRAIVSHIPRNGGGGGGGGGGVVNPNGGGAANEGTDILLNIEQVRFPDGVITLGPVATNNSVVGSVQLSNNNPVPGAAITAIPQVFDADGIDTATEAFRWQTWDGFTRDFFGDPVWLDVAGAFDVYTVQQADMGAVVRVLYSFTDLAGNYEAVLSDPTSAVVPGIATTPVAALALVVPADITSPTVTLTATFTDAAGAPIVGADVTFDQGGTVLGVAATDATGVATLVTTLTVAPDTQIILSASAVDPAPVDPALSAITSFTEFRTVTYPGASMLSAGTATEGSGLPLTATISLDRPAPADVTIDWATTGNTATDGTDFIAAGGTATILAGQTTVDVAVGVLDDSLVETDETVDFTISAATGAVIAGATAATATIVDNDLPVMSIGVDQTVTEGIGATVSFDINLDQAPVNPVSVAWSLVPGTARAGPDFLGATGIAAFAPGQTTATVVVTIVDDTAVEFAETFSLRTGAITGATGPATATAAATILDDDMPVVDAGANLSVLEGNRNARTPMNFTLQLDRPSVYPVSITWSTLGGTATVGTDYTGTGGTVTIPAGQLTATVPVSVLGDTTAETDETVPFTITNVTNATAGRLVSTGTILDDDTAPTASINNVSQLEGRSGNTTFTFTVTLSTAPRSTVTMRANTVAATASASSDFAAVRNRLITFTPGQRTAVVTVSVKGDRVREANETFRVQLSNAVGTTFVKSSGTGTITNDD